jgi:quinol-cytochrome oxidoreductase complex cytochrome b subunit
MTQSHEEKDTIPFFPDHVRTEAIALVGILALVLVIGILGTINPVGLGPPADPMDTPEHIKPEWYFLFLYELLKYVPKTFGSSLLVIGAVGLLIWPFVDRRADTKRARTIRIVLVIIGLIAVVGLTLMGELS